MTFAACRKSAVRYHGTARIWAYRCDACRVIINAMNVPDPARGPSHRDNRKKDAPPCAGRMVPLVDGT